MTEDQTPPTDSEDTSNAPTSTATTSRRPRRRLRLILISFACILVIAVGGVALWDFLFPMYTATASFRVSSKRQKILFDTADQANQRDFEIYKTTQVELLKSVFVAVAALRDNDQLNQLPVIKKQVDPVLWLAQEIQVRFKGELMYVSLTGGDPQAVTSLVNAVVNAYMQEEVLVESASRRARLNDLEKLYAQTDTKVRNKRAEIKNFARTLGSDSKALALRQQAIIEELTTYHGKRIQIRFDLYAFQSELAAKNQRVKQVQELRGDASVDSVAENEGPLVDPDFQMLVSLRLVPFSLTLQSVPERPVESRTQQLKADIEDLDLKIRMFEQQDSMIQREIQKLESQISEVAETSVDVEMMRPELEQLASILQTIASERERMRIEFQSEDRIRLRHNAQQPKAKNSLWDRLQRLLRRDRTQSEHPPMTHRQ